MQSNSLPSEENVNRVMAALKERHIEPELVAGRQAALERLVQLIPAGASVMTGSSITLEEIGFVDMLISGDHPWENLKAGIIAEKDPVREVELRRRSTLADYFLGSAHAITENGIVLIASASGSQLPAYAYCSANVIWVAGAHKIVPDLDTAFRRVREYVFPLEDEHMKSMGAEGSNFGKWLIFERETSSLRRVRMILVNEKLGF